MTKIKEFRKKIKKHQLLILTIIIGVLIIGAWLLTYFILENQKDRGTFGDMFGSINALFSGLALAGIILTILLQKQELGYQRIELKETREEFKINRLTNILFKQIEYFNSIIENEKFGNKNISELILTLNHLEEHSPSDFNSLIDKHSEKTISLLTKVIPLMENFEHLLDESKIQINEKHQMKGIFFHNINPYFFSLIRYDLTRNVTFESITDSTEKTLQQGFRNISIQRINYILKYKEAK